MHNRGSRFAALAGLAILVLLPATESRAAASPAPDSGFLIPWGEGDAELGFRAGPEMEPLCVQTWCLTPRGTFLLLDPVARKVKEFGSDGRWIRSWGRDIIGSSLACGPNGTPFVLDGPELRRVAAESPPEDWVILPAAVPPGYGQGLRRAGEDGLVVADRGRTRYAVGGRDRAITEPPSEGVRIGRQRDRATAVRGTVCVDLGTAAGTVLPAATLGDGTDVVEVERRQADGTWRLEVWFIDRGPATRAIDTGPCDDVSVLYRRIAVAPNGTVYRARTTAGGFEILRFEPRHGETR